MEPFAYCIIRKISFCSSPNVFSLQICELFGNQIKIISKTIHKSICKYNGYMSIEICLLLLKSPLKVGGCTFTFCKIQKYTRKKLYFRKNSKITVESWFELHHLLWLLTATKNLYFFVNYIYKFHSICVLPGRNQDQYWLSTFNIFF